MKIPDTTRLSFTFMTHNDAGQLFELDQDVEVMRYINGGKKTSMEEIHSRFIPRLESYANESEGWGLWKVCTRLDELENGSSFIGWVLVRPMNFFSDAPQYHNLELGWRFKRLAWGKGYATEAAKAVMETVCAPEKINTVSAIAIEDNTSSINVMKKLGMTFVKKAIHHDPLGEMELVFYQKSLNN
ncbi:GNAT family N-acetyltransferase [uncultured Shewanella sp.]|uniref:GNAT family N-acetyltransferase n=1 Tax=uncultured Shewanella sp. TaxID=173975 RepID=UPI00262C719C|nr:GNAT family N-acetyltransferase [uncultured Shewanella sp.]